MMMVNGKPVPFGAILVVLLFLGFIFPKAVFTLVLLFLAIIILLGALLFYRFRKWFSFFRTAADTMNENKQNRQQNAYGYKMHSSTKQKHPDVFECEEYEVIDENEQDKEKNQE